MKLNPLLEKSGRAERGPDDAMVTGFAIDHRKVAPGTIFGAFEGTVVNGEDFIDAAVAAGAAASIRHLKTSDRERTLHQERVAEVRRKLDAMGIPHLPNPSHIIPVMVGDAKKCKMISDWLMENHGIYVQPINYPTVPVGTERLRITPSPVHTDGDTGRLIDALSEIWSQCELARMDAVA